MTDPSRSPRPWTFGVVAVWGAAGCVVHLLRGVDFGWAALLSAGLTGLTIAAMYLLPKLFSRRLAAVDPLDTTISDLINDAAAVEQRVRRWTLGKLDDGVRREAKAAHEVTVAVVALLGSSYHGRSDADPRLPRLRDGVKKISERTRDKPVTRADWHELRDDLDRMYAALSAAVNSAGNQSGTPDAAR